VFLDGYVILESLVFLRLLIVLFTVFVPASFSFSFRLLQ